MISTQGLQWLGLCTVILHTHALTFESRYNVWNTERNNPILIMYAPTCLSVHIEYFSFFGFIFVVSFNHEAAQYRLLHFMFFEICQQQRFTMDSFCTRNRNEWWKLRTEQDRELIRSFDVCSVLAYKDESVHILFTSLLLFIGICLFINGCLHEHSPFRWNVYFSRFSIKCSIVNIIKKTHERHEESRIFSAKNKIWQKIFCLYLIFFSFSLSLGIEWMKTKFLKDLNSSMIYVCAI